MGLTIVSPILNFCTYYSTGLAICQAFFSNFLAPSCRPPPTVFQSLTGAGSHLYSAQQDSVRSRVCWVSLTRLSWGLPSGFCSSLCVSIIAHSVGFVKNFFRPPKKIHNLFLTSLRTRQGFVASFISPIWCYYYSPHFEVCQEGICRSVTELSHPPRKPVGQFPVPSWHYVLYHTPPQNAIDRMYKIGKIIFLKIVQLSSWQKLNGSV